MRTGLASIAGGWKIGAGSFLESTRSALEPVQNLVVPIVAMYAGQFLIVTLPSSKAWGEVIIILSLTLLLLRLRAPSARGPADAFQMGLGLVLGLPLVLNVDGWNDSNPTWQVLGLWLLSAGIVALATLKLRPQPIAVGLEAVPRLDRLDLLLVVLLLAGAVLLRVPSIETIPMGVDPDEASLAESALNAATGLTKDPFATGWVTHPVLEFFYSGLFIRWLGRTFVAMRLPWAILGSLAVAAVYLLARVGYGRRVAVLAGILAMTSNVAIHFSRLGLNNIGDSLFVAWVLAAFWYAAASGSPRAYVLAGAGLGLSQYFYFGVRAIPFVVAATFLVWLVADWRGVWRARYLILASLLVALALADPLLGHWIRHPGSLTEHLGLTLPFSAHLQNKAAQMQVPLASLWWDQIYASLFVFTMVPDRGSFYHPGQAMLHPIQAPIFLIGVLAVLAAWRRPINRGLLAWIGIELLLGSVLITDAATFHRLLGVLPAAILVTAIGIDAGVTALASSARWSPKAAAVLAGLIVIVFSVVDVAYYFGSYSTQQAYKPPTQEAVSIAALEYSHLSGQGRFVLFTQEGVDAQGTIYHAPITYVAGKKFLAGVPGVMNALDPTPPLYFYVLPDRAADLPGLMARFPGGTLQEYHRRSDGLLLMTRYAVGQKE